MNHQNPEAGLSKIFFRGIPRTVMALGLVSMFMDISSEMIHSLLPVFLISVLNAGTLTVGMIEGVAEATALIAKTFSGALSDAFKRRKLLALAGYGLAALTKPIFAVAPNVSIVFAARFLDRVGKGIRGAPRDAFVADVTDSQFLGAAYGLRQSLDTAGAFMGPLLAVGFMLIFSGNFRWVFWVSVIPGLVAVFILAVWIKEPESHLSESAKKPIGFRDIFKLTPAYWMVVTLGFVFTLVRFSEAFLLLRAQSVGMAAGMIPLILVLMNIVYSLTAYPVGRLSDHLGRMGLMVAGLAVLIISDVILAMAERVLLVAAGAALWGLHMGLTQGVLSAMVADTAAENFRGTAFGIFSMISGIAILIASIIAGGLWEFFGPSAAFFSGAAFAAVALIGFIIRSKHLTFASRHD